jgi:hypothetical protein
MLLVSILGFGNSLNLAHSPASNVFPSFPAPLLWFGDKLSCSKRQRPSVLACNKDLKQASANNAAANILTLDNPSSDVEKRRWYFFSDAVMGGVSRGEVFMREVYGRKAVEMRGTVSLDNNGGFIQIAFDLNGTGILLSNFVFAILIPCNSLMPQKFLMRVLGTGSSWTCTAMESRTMCTYARIKFIAFFRVTGETKAAEIEARSIDLAWPNGASLPPFLTVTMVNRCTFTTKKEVWQTLRLPFLSFEPYRIDEALDTSRMRRVAIVAIGRARPAAIAVGGVRLYRA